MAITRPQRNTGNLKNGSGYRKCILPQISVHLKICKSVAHYLQQPKSGRRDKIQEKMEDKIMHDQLIFTSEIWETKLIFSKSFLNHHTKQDPTQQSHPWRLKSKKNEDRNSRSPEKITSSIYELPDLYVKQNQINNGSAIPPSPATQKCNTSKIGKSLMIRDCQSPPKWKAR